ncbi:hypothetical protein [uncultured Sphingomonas sp.]|uniref:hypothetical protein n=1 Tax=uncultured Sphingomonas sp. TaxID=158754 RepID=UPI0025E6929B|nr:hypothetical protein [uncultured Sphingomonas sp.]
MHHTRLALEVFNVEQVRAYRALFRAVSDSQPGAVRKLNLARERVAAAAVAKAARGKSRSPRSLTHPDMSGLREVEVGEAAVRVPVAALVEPQSCRSGWPATHASETGR